MGGFSPIHLLVLAVVAILLLGGGRFSNLMGDVAKGIKAFKKGMAEDETPAGQAPAVPPPSNGEPVRTLPHQGEPATASHVSADRKVV
jgi:sec-independent protein translocase protein TatA